MGAKKTGKTERRRTSRHQSNASKHRTAVHPQSRSASRDEAVAKVAPLDAGKTASPEIAQPASQEPELPPRPSSRDAELLGSLVHQIAGSSMRTAPIRLPLPTIGYEDRPAHAIPPRGPNTSAPELITIDQTPIGRATQAAIEEALADEIIDRSDHGLSASPPHREGAMKPEEPATSALTAEAYEIRTFVVRDQRMTTESSEDCRREYVEKRLLHRLPALSMKEVARIEVAPSANPESFTVHVWCRVPQPPC